MPRLYDDAEPLPGCPRRLVRVLSTARLNPEATSWAADFEASATRCAPDLIAVPASVASRLTADPKARQGFELVSALGAESAAWTPNPGASRRAITSTAIALLMIVIAMVVIAMIVSAIFIVVMSMIALTIPIPIMIAVLGLVAGFVFGRSHEVYRPIASVIFAAVFAPIFRVPRRNVQVQRWRRHRLRLDQHGLRVNERRRSLVADLYLAVYTRRHLARQNDVNVEITCLAGADAGPKQGDECECAHWNTSGVRWRGSLHEHRVGAQLEPCRNSPTDRPVCSWSLRSVMQFAFGAPPLWR
jgi:hypothetical protein